MDVVAYHPQTEHLLHLEPSIDADSWAKREQRFSKKFKFGRKYIRKSVFPWVDKKIRIEQIAVLIAPRKTRLAGGRVISIDQFVSQVKFDILAIGKMGKKAIPEEYDLLRTIQLTICGYYKVL